ncbi:MAG TPA: hypothetical protein PKN13_02245 [Accumulibacter sp.]|nr:hypothetical protein [Accumulibacter sp.]HMW17163.1 hypothetical protein [Accumulibacter sp.]HMX23705.1 hypothetical protein [Accumulibacter sp.]HMY05870.1 hypothetical protein [Accumulibacter sp.]HNC16593.1 hypothetical protein [Accumulibacter sp.]
MSPAEQQVTVFDDRPFFERALRHGVQQGLIDRQQIERFFNDAPKGIVQIADHFGSAYLRPNIELARQRLVNLISLFLEESSVGDLDRAACSLRDHTLLSHSRGGSEMLKSLWALPEDTTLGAVTSRISQKAFLADWSLRTLADYRHVLKQRQENRAAIETAQLFVTQAKLSLRDVDGASAETILRSALLVTLSGKSVPLLPNGSEFLGLLKHLHGKSVSTKSRQRVHTLLAGLSPSAQPSVEREWRHLEKHDIPRLLDRNEPLDRLYTDLAPAYFLRDFNIDDSAPLEAATSSRWRQVTGGKTDDSALLTVFVCLAVGVAPKPTLSRKAARALIQQSRTDGLRNEPVRAFIRDFAPLAMQDDLDVLWQEFFSDAETYLLDDADDTLGQAMRFLREHCAVV